MSEYSDIEEIIIKSLIGSLEEHEQVKLNDWRNSSSENNLSYELMRKTWQAKSPEPLHKDYELMERMIIEAGFKKSSWISTPKKQWLFRAAALITLICISTWVILKSIPGDQAILHSSELVVTYNPSGQKSKISLPDNSVIWLNSESKISYQKGFTDSVRYLELEGEAYFEVEPDASRPFIVETGDIMTTALGTSFNIRNYPDENSISVSLISGKVRVNDNKATNELFLEPLEQIKFSRYNRQLKMIQLDEDIVSIWKDGVLRFKRSSFDHVITTLERTYDVTIDTSAYTHGPWSYSGNFNNMSLEIVLTRIGYSEGFDFEIEGNKIVIIDE